MDAPATVADDGDNQQEGETRVLLRAGRRIADAALAAAKFKPTVNGKRIVREFEVQTCRERREDRTDAASRLGGDAAKSGFAWTVGDARGRRFATGGGNGVVAGVRMVIGIRDRPFARKVRQRAVSRLEGASGPEGAPGSD